MRHPIDNAEVAVRRHSARLVRLTARVMLSAAVLCTLGAGCDTPPGSGGAGSTQSGALFGGSEPRDGRERWTIRAMHTEAPNHAQYAQQLADLLRKVDGIDPGKVRVVTDQRGSTIYYGEYVKQPSPERDRLVFPPEYQRDIEFIRRLALNQSTPFFYAEPELIDRTPGEVGPYDVSKAAGSYTLYIAVFYNTATFQQRREAANEYVRLLREAGYSAYYYHDPHRSYVFVGDFTEQDIVTRNGQPTFGPRVESFIQANEAEFRHLSENGQIVKQQMPNGAFQAPLSYLVPVPKKGAAVTPTPPGTGSGSQP
jgi:hypothetical protein